MARKGKPVQVYIDEGLKAQVEELARQHGRPLADEIIHALLRHVASPPRLVTPEMAEVPGPRPQKRGRPKKAP